MEKFTKESKKIRDDIKEMVDDFRQVVFIADSYGNSYIKWDAKSVDNVIELLEKALRYMKQQK